nr:alanine racemase [Pseudoglutamicibacter cumminsii]
MHAHDAVAAAPERCAEVDLGALAANVARVRELVGAAHIMAIVKAQAYGHGAVACAQAALEAGATWVGTAHVSEALELRTAGIDAPALCWLHTSDTDFEAAVAHGIDIGVSGWELERVIEASHAVGRVARIHLKIDTGLGRNGCTASQWPQFVERAAAAERAGDVRVVGVFSHYAMGDEPEHPANDAQTRAFEDALAVVAEAGLEPEVRHIANTPTVFARTDAMYDMVRVGLGLYGLSPFEGKTSADLGLRPAMRLVAHVAGAKRVDAGQGVSYGLRWHAEQPTTLGLVPVGYADGIPRIAEGTHVSIDGVRYPVVGRIAMDQFVIDLGPDAEPADFLGEDAVVFGDPERGEPAVEEWSEASLTINYETVTRISDRVPRRMVRGGAAGGGESHGSAADSPLSLTIDTPSAMQRFARALAGELHAGDVLILTGELGAGKTTFTQGLGEGLGVREGITSPTFVLSRIHPSLTDGPALVHVDAYRLGSAEELEDLDLIDTVDESVTVVEWGRDRAEGLSESRLEIMLERPIGGGAAEEAAAEPNGDAPAPWEIEDEEEAAAPRIVTLRWVGPRWNDAAAEGLRAALAGFVDVADVVESQEDAKQEG